VSAFWYPGIMVSQIWPDACYHQGATADAVLRVIDTGCFRAIQTVQISTPRERRTVRDRLEAERIEHTYCIARSLSEAKLNLSSIDEPTRRKSSEMAIRGLEHARECGSKRLSFVSGPRPTRGGTRGEALVALRRSLEEIALAAMRDPAVIPVIEPLDTETHKMGTLGTVRETTELCEDLQKLGLPVTVCADTSHMILNGEDPVSDTVACGRSLAEFHLCNPVLDANDPMYGDRHIPFGPPGVLMPDDLPGIAGSVGQGLQMVSGGLPLFLEVINRHGSDADAAEGLLQYNIRIVRELLGDPV
jgi:sugar phosphate isomerase/epimerase